MTSPACVQPDVSKSLDYVRLAPPARSVADHRHVLSLVDEVFQAVEDAPARSAGPTMDAPLVDGFPSDTGGGVEVMMTKGAGVGVSYPGHLPLPSPHVRGWHVNGRTQETFLGELNRKPPGDELQLVVRVVLRVDLDAALPSSKRNINTGTLVGHQS